MDYLRDFVSGELDIPEFLQQLKTNEALQAEIKDLIPQEARDNPQDVLWDKQWNSYDLWKSWNFDPFVMMHRCRYRFDLSFGDNLNVYSTLSKLYLRRHPDAKSTTKYRDTFQLFLDGCGDCFEGPEVRVFTENLLLPLLAIPQKGKRTAAVKQAIREAFHIEDRNRPYWIQGAEWPMGSRTPMKYLSRKKTGDGCQYYFVDVDTGEARIVQQWY